MVSAELYRCHRRRPCEALTSQRYGSHFLPYATPFLAQLGSHCKVLFMCGVRLLFVMFEAAQRTAM